jgi:hypothetical protein
MAISEDTELPLSQASADFLRTLESQLRVGMVWDAARGLARVS